MKHFAWYLARATGIVAWFMLAAGVLWGYVLSARPFANAPKPGWVLAVHRFLGVLSVIFVGLHLAGLVGDTYVHFGASQLFVPMAARWHPLAVAWGVVGLYLLLAIELTSLVMKHLPRRLWLMIHRLSFVLFVLATMHFVSSGTDARAHPAIQVVAVTVLSLSLFLYLVRVLSPRAAAARERRARNAPRTPVDEREGATPVRRAEQTV